MPHVETFDPELERAHRRMDDIERKLQRFNNPTPTIPEYDLQQTVVFDGVYITLRYQAASYPPWWDLDNTYNGNTRWLSAWSASEVGWLGILAAGEWNWIAGDINGFFTPDSPAPGTNPPRIAVGQVGNGYFNLQTITFIFVNHGDVIGWVGGHTTFNPPGVDLWSDPYHLVQAQIYDETNTILLHDFDTMQVDVGTHDLGTPVSTQGPFADTDIWSSATYTIP